MKNNHYDIFKLDKNLWAIKDIASTENSISYLVCGKNKALLFDMGLGLSPISPLLRRITSLPVIACLSHWHFDHSGGAYEFEHLIGWGSEYMRQVSLRGITNELIHTQVGTDFWKSIGKKNHRTQKFPQITMIDEEQSIDIGEYNFKIVHTPGHTKDSICLYEPKMKWLFSGDTVYHGPLYLHFDDAEMETYKQSINKLCEYDIESIYPGHNDVRLSKDILSAIDSMLKNCPERSEKYPRLRILY